MLCCGTSSATSNTLLMLRCGASSCNMLVGGLGRMALLSTTARDKIEHRNLLCAHYLNKEPGLERVLRALAVHRQKASNGLTSPSRCFQKPLWNLWPQWKAQKKGDYQHLGRCGKHRLYWYLQWILMGLHFPWRSQGFCIIILMTMYGHLIKSATLPRNLLLPFCKTNTFC